jgi:hypothetical protein
MRESKVYSKHANAIKDSLKSAYAQYLSSPFLIDYNQLVQDLKAFDSFHQTLVPETPCYEAATLHFDEEWISITSSFINNKELTTRCLGIWGVVAAIARNEKGRKVYNENRKGSSASSLSSFSLFLFSCSCSSFTLLLLFSLPFAPLLFPSSSFLLSFLHYCLCIHLAPVLPLRSLLFLTFSSPLLSNTEIIRGKYLTEFEKKT